VIPHQISDPQCYQLTAARNSPNDQKPHPSLNLDTGSFNIWWQRVFTQHSVMTAQASALMRRIGESAHPAIPASIKHADHASGEFGHLKEVAEQVANNELK